VPIAHLSYDHAPSRRPSPNYGSFYVAADDERPMDIAQKVGVPTPTLVAANQHIARFTASARLEAGTRVTLPPPPHRVPAAAAGAAAAAAAPSAVRRRSVRTSGLPPGVPPENASVWREMEGLLRSFAGSTLPEDALKQIRRQAVQLASLARGESSAVKLRQWLEELQAMPFGKFAKLKDFGDSAESSQAFIVESWKSLADVSYGQGAAKRELVAHVAQWGTAGEVTGCILGLHGPPGTGKTALLRKHLASVLGLPCAFIPLGGLNDVSLLCGHNYTYEGAGPGRIAAELSRANVMNPILVFDELDKIPDGKEGGAVKSLLMQITDHSQNSVFKDRYFHGIPIDLSRVVLVFTFNDPSKIDTVLMDRLHVVEVPGYNQDAKVQICILHSVKSAVEAVLPAHFLAAVDVDKVPFLVADGIVQILQDCGDVAREKRGEKTGMRAAEKQLAKVLRVYNLLRLVLLVGPLDAKGAARRPAVTAPELVIVDSLTGGGWDRAALRALWQWPVGAEAVRLLGR